MIISSHRSKRTRRKGLYSQIGNSTVNSKHVQIYEPHRNNNQRLSQSFKTNQSRKNSGKMSKIIDKSVCHNQQNGTNHDRNIVKNCDKHNISQNSLFDSNIIWQMFDSIYNKNNNNNNNNNLKSNNNDNSTNNRKYNQSHNNIITLFTFFLAFCLQFITGMKHNFPFSLNF